MWVYACRGSIRNGNLRLWDSLTIKMRDRERLHNNENLAGYLIQESSYYGIKGVAQSLSFVLLIWFLSFFRFKTPLGIFPLRIGFFWRLGGIASNIFL